MFGEKVNIYNPQWLEVVFKGRNQAYGAYELRKENPRTINKALIIAIVCFLVAVGSPTIINIVSGFIPKAKEKVKSVDVVLLPPPPLDKAKPPPPPPKEPPKPKVDQVKFPPPIVKPDNEVKEKDPPTEKQLEVADPGQKEQKATRTRKYVSMSRLVTPTSKPLPKAMETLFLPRLKLNPSLPVVCKSFTIT